MRAAVLAAVLLAGCASSPEYVAQQGNFDVCRLSMRGPHARAADLEAQRRGLDCRPYYGAIQAQQAGDAAALQNYLRATTPAPAQPPRTCQTYRVGNTLETQCF